MSTSQDSEDQTVVVIGLSGGGLKTFKMILDKLYDNSGQPKTSKRIKLIGIDKSRFPYWPPGSLRASVLNGFEEKIIRSFDHIIPRKFQNNNFVKIVIGTEVVNLDLKNKLILLDKPLNGLETEPGNNKLKFDYLVIASGSSYPFPCRPPPEIERAEELKIRLEELQQEIECSQSIVIVGGGVVGIELAGEVSWQHKHKSITLICSTLSLLPDMNPKLGKSLQHQLAQRKVKIIFGSKANLGPLGITKTGKLDQMSKIGLVGSDGGESAGDVEADFIFLALGNKPNTKFVPSEYLDLTSKLIKVDEHLQVIEPDSQKSIEGVYGVGDAIDFAESKLYAALDGQARTVSTNMWIDMTKSISDRKVVHKPIKDTISIPLGPCGGVSELYGWTFGLGVGCPCG